MPQPRTTTATLRRTPHAIEGVWLPVRLEFAGEAAPELVIARTEVIFCDGKYTTRFGGEASFHGSYTLAPNTPPAAESHALAQATLHIEGARVSENRAIVIRGIYQLVGDRLRMCLSLDGALPTSFATQSGSQRYLGTYRRQK